MLCVIGSCVAYSIWSFSILAFAALDDDTLIINPVARLDTVRIIVRDGQYDPMEESSGYTQMHLFCGIPTVFKWLLHQEEFFIDFEYLAEGYTIASSHVVNSRLYSLEYLEALAAAKRGSKDPFELHIFREITGDTLIDIFVRSLQKVTDEPDLSKRIKVLWDAGIDFHASAENRLLPLEALLTIVLYQRSIIKPSEQSGRDTEHKSIQRPLSGVKLNVEEYEGLEDNSAVKDRSRTPRSLWRTWYPGHDLSILEVVQRHFDAWTEVLFEAGLDITEYGRRKKEIYPGGLLQCGWGEARILFEFGEHVDGCRIQITETWLYGLDNREYDFNNKKEPTSTGNSKMPGGWCSDEDVENEENEDESISADSTT